MKINWKQVSISLFIGLLAGTFLGSWVWKHHFREHRWGDNRFSRILERFNSKLDLTPDQRSKVAAILDEKRKKIKAMRSDMKPRWEKLRNSTKDEIRNLLNPKQMEKFEILQEKMESRWKKWGHRHGKE